MSEMTICADGIVPENKQSGQQERIQVCHESQLYLPLGSEAAQQAHLQSTLARFEVLAIDGGLMLDETTYKRVSRIVGIFKAHRTNLTVWLVVHDDKEKSHAQVFQHDMMLANIGTVFSQARAQEHDAILSTVMQRDRNGVAWKISAGKKILYLTSRTGRFIEPFTPPHGIICHKFYKLALGTECPHDCSYCYLQLTFRITPYVRVYLNLEKLWLELARFSAQIKQPVLLNSGELADPLALDPVTNLVNETLQVMSKHDNLALLLLTKSCNTDQLKPIGTGQAIVSTSLTTPWNAMNFEHGTAHPYDRIDALARAQEKGFRARCRIDPILCASKTWEQDYEELFNHLFRQTRVEVITLGQPRFYPSLLSIVEKRYPEEGKYFQWLAQARTKDHRQRAGTEERLQIYTTILDMIERKRNDNTMRIMVCKEDPEVFRRLKTRINPGYCNCLYEA